MTDIDIDPIQVIHVDDDPEIVNLASTFLEREDDRLEIEPAETANEALDHLTEHTVHCLISDYQLPDMGCEEFVTAIHEEAPGLPFILFTGRDRSQLDTELLKTEITDYLQKGSGTEQYSTLAETIVTAVGTHQEAQTDGGYRLEDDADREPRTDGGTNQTGSYSKSNLERLDIGDRETVLAKTLDAIDDGAFVLDAKDKLVYWNRRLETITGYDETEITGSEPTDFFVPDDHDAVQTAINNARTDGTASVDTAVRSTNGEQQQAEFRGQRIADDAGDQTYIVGIIRDISDRTAYEQELERQHERLEEVVGAVSHDLRNPLNVITGRLELAREMGDEEHFDAMDRAAQQIGTLIDDLVGLARNGNTVDETEEIDLNELARQTWERLETGEATLSVEADQTVKGDRTRLRITFENLFRNAIENAGDEVTVEVGDLADGFYVADDGPGIPEEDREAVFEYGESGTREKAGLGLALVRRIIEAHGWSVTVTDSDLGGAQFEITTVSTAGPPAP